MERLQNWDSNQGTRYEVGKIQEGCKITKRLGRYKKDGKIWEGCENMRKIVRYKKASKVWEQDGWGFRD